MPTSRQRFDNYRARVSEQFRNGRNGHAAQTSGDQPPLAAEDERRRRKKSRSFGRLLVEFFRLMGNQRRMVIFALVTLTAATLLKLLPPAAIKVAIDYVLPGRPLPEPWQQFGLPTDRRTLIIWLGLVVVGISFITTAIQIWGRWYATKAVNRMQVSLRKQAFEHAVRDFAATFATLMLPRKNPFFRQTDALFDDTDWTGIAGVTAASTAAEERLFGDVQRAVPPGMDPAGYTAEHMPQQGLS